MKDRIQLKALAKINLGLDVLRRSLNLLNRRNKFLRFFYDTGIAI